MDKPDRWGSLWVQATGLIYPMLYIQAAHMAGQAAKLSDFVFFARSGYSRSQPYTTGRFTSLPMRGRPLIYPLRANCLTRSSTKRTLTSMLRIGDKAPDLRLTTLDEQPISLAETWRGGHTALLVFLRHLG